MNRNTKMSVALVPDRLALYRYAIFRRLSLYSENNYQLTIYADTKEDVPGLSLVDAAYCDRDYSNGGISWVQVKNVAVRKICFWQTGLINLALSNEHDVHVYWGEAHRVSTWISALISRLRGKRVVFWTHGIYGNENRLKLVVRCCFYRLAHALLLYSDHGKNLLVQYGFDPCQMFVIKNSLDVRRQDALYQKYLKHVRGSKAKFFSENDHMLLFVGRLEPQKKLKMLLEALALLKRQGTKSYKLLVIGDGSQRHVLSEYAIRLNLEEDVYFYGACYDEEKLAPLIIESDVCVSPGEVGLTAMHSLIFGTPVVTHDNFAEQMPEFEAIVPGSSGHFYEFSNVNDMALKISEVIRLLDDGVINAYKCRAPILKYYNDDYQQLVFSEMLGSV